MICVHSFVVGSHVRFVQHGCPASHVWPKLPQPCGSPHVPVVEPGGTLHGNPVQQSVAVVHAPPIGWHVAPHTNCVSEPGTGTHGRPQQSALVAHVSPT